MNEELIEHTMNPRNIGKIENPTCTVSYGNLKCGEVITFYINVLDDICADIKYEYYGCGMSLPFTSIISEYIKGKSISFINEFLQTKKADDMINCLKIRKCEVITADALRCLFKKVV